jgi:hypothetical protein
MATAGSRGGGKQLVGELWSLDWKLTSVAQGDSYKVVDPTTRKNLLVWTTRMPLKDEQRKAFEQHVAKLATFQTLPVISHNVDREGIGYAALQINGCTPLDSIKSTPLEARYRFITCVTRIASLHKLGVVLDNISLGSFALNSEHEVEFIGILGGFSMPSPDAVPIEVRTYLPPSSSHGSVSGAKADVYALAVVGLRLFGAQFPPSGVNPDDMELYLARVQEGAPRWVSQVLGSIVKQPGASALRDADDLLAALAEHERRYPVVELDLTSQREGHRAGPAVHRLSVQEIVRRDSLPSRRSQFSSVKRLVYRGAGPVLVLGLLLGVAMKADLIPIGKLSSLLPWLVEMVPTSSQARVHVAQPEASSQHGKSLSFEDVVANFESLSADGNHGSLWQVVFDKLTAEGYQNTAITTAAVVRSGAVLVRQPAMLAALVHPDISTDERLNRLGAYDEVAPEIAGRIAAAFALDEPGGRDVFRKFLLQSVGRLVESSGSNKLDDRSTSALIIASDLRNELDAARTVEVLKELSPADYWWLISFHAQKRSDKLKSIIEGLLSRDICQYPRKVFLQIAREAEVSPDTPYDALVASAQRDPSSREVALFSEWLAPQSEQALYAVLLTATDQTVIRATLDALRSKPQLDELVVEVVTLVRSTGDARLLEYAPFMGALGLRGMLDAGSVIQGLRSVQNMPNVSLLAQKIFERGDPKIITLALPLYGQLVNPSLLLPLLRNADPEIRIRVLPLLKNLPLASSRAELSELYVAEKDPRVRSAYEREVL